MRAAPARDVGGNRSGGAPSRRTAAMCLVASVLAVAAPARAQDLSCKAGDTEVRSLAFAGNRAFPDAELANIIVTTPSNWWSRHHLPFFGTKRCLDRTEFPRDVVRLKFYYRQRGYAAVRVDTTVAPVGAGAVRITFRIAEGTPVRLTRLEVRGLHATGDSAGLMRRLPLGVGRPFDKFDLRDAIDTLGRRLHNIGFPRAQILTGYDKDTVADTASLTITAIPGPLSRIGDIDLEVTPLDGRGQQISDANVRTILGVKEGDIYSEQRLINAQRSLYQTDAYQRVEIALVGDSVPRPDSSARISVHLTENYMNAASLGVGWGTLDCFRAQGAFTNRDFLRGARQLELTARVSKIGVGRPVSSTALVNGLCRSAGPRVDTFSVNANYYVSATFRQPVFLGLRTVPTVTLYSERRSEFKAYERSTPIGGIASVTRQHNPALPMTFSYELSLGHTTAQPALFCAVFNRCAPVEQQKLLETKRLAVASWTLAHSTADNAGDPTRGATERLELRHASKAILSDPDLQFNKAVGDVAWYHVLTPGNIFAFRLRVGTVLGSKISFSGAQQFVPPQERLYAGGATTVRGYRQNELGPIVYQARGFRAEAKDGTPLSGPPLPGDTVYLRMDSTQRNFILRNIPTGGNTAVVGSFEARLRSPFLPSLVQLAAFADVGQVWNRGNELLRFKALRWTPGVGARVFTPVGAIRVDVGYNGYQLEGGAVYANATSDVGSSPLLCVSPGNSIPAFVETLPGGGIRTDAAGNPVYRQNTYAACDGKYQPTLPSSVLKRLTLAFSIGQAF